jgi:hypothetical protein
MFGTKNIFKKDYIYNKILYYKVERMKLNVMEVLWQ